MKTITKDDIRRARALIEDEKNWTTVAFARAKNGCSVDPESPNACQFSGLGALRRARVLGAREDSIDLRCQGLIGIAQTVTLINDDEGHAAVLALFDQMIERAPESAMTDALIPQDFEEAGKYGNLGPHYFAARRVVDGAMASFTSEHLDGIAKTATDALYEKLQSVIEDSLWSDAEMNLQGKMWQMVDQIVRGILSGEQWIVDRYVLGSRYECDKVREAVARHFEDDVAKARISDLESEIARLNEQVRWLSR